MPLFLSAAWVSCGPDEERAAREVRMEAAPREASEFVATTRGRLERIERRLERLRAVAEALDDTRRDSLMRRIEWAAEAEQRMRQGLAEIDGERPLLELRTELNWMIDGLELLVDDTESRYDPPGDSLEQLGPGR